MKRHALFVGVDQYADPTIQNLNFPSEDASELASAFKLLLKFDRVEKLINPSHSPDVVDAVKEMTRGLGPGDLFVFFFAGHGFRVKENHVLVCARDDCVDLENEYAGLPVGQLKMRMRGPWNRMVVLDACQNDIRATRGADIGATARDLDLIHAFDAVPTPGCGRQILVTSCSEGQKALEVSDLGHGLFTSAFLDSVTAFANNRRRIDLESLRTDLGARMGGLIARYRLSGRQEPLFTMPADAAGIVLLDGSAMPPPSAPFAPPVLVTCPICGKKNYLEDTFKCCECGRDNLCLEHRDEETFLCKDCAENEAHRDHEKAVRQVSAREIVFVTLAACAIALVALSGGRFADGIKRYMGMRQSREQPAPKLEPLKRPKKAKQTLTDEEIQKWLGRRVKVRDMTIASEDVSDRSGDVTDLATIQAKFKAEMSSIEATYSKQVKEWQDRYNEALTHLLQDYQKGGNFFGWEATKEEIDRFERYRALYPANIVKGSDKLASLQKAYLDPGHSPFFLGGIRQSEAALARVRLSAPFSGFGGYPGVKHKGRSSCRSSVWRRASGMWRPHPFP